MRILVALVSSNTLVCKTFIEREHQILNGDFLPRGLREQASFSACVFDPRIPGVSLSSFILGKSGDVDAVAVLLDQRWQNLTQGLRNALFVGIFDFSEYMPSVQNFLSGCSARLLRNLGHLLHQLSESTVFQAAVLPLRNFEAEELQELARICEESVLESTFPNEVKIPLRALIERRGPKRRSSYPTRYFKDDCGLFFQYGDEEHSRFETGGEHLAACHINGLFRFGKRLNEKRHFNVTQSDSDDHLISGTFVDCHGAPVEVVRRTHINMFTNDFHK